MNHTISTISASSDTNIEVSSDTATTAASPTFRRVARATLSIGALAGAAWLTAAPYVWMF